MGFRVYDREDVLSQVRDEFLLGHTRRLCLLRGHEPQKVQRRGESSSKVRVTFGGQAQRFKG